MRDVAYTEDRTERMLAFDAILDNHMRCVQGIMARMKELEDIQDYRKLTQPTKNIDILNPIEWIYPIKNVDILHSIGPTQPTKRLEI